jgi:hypothetical protein
MYRAGRSETLGNKETQLQFEEKWQMDNVVTTPIPNFDLSLLILFCKEKGLTGYYQCF